MKILATMVYMIAMMFTAVLAYQHTQEVPLLSGWFAFIVFMLVPQLALAMLLTARQYENAWQQHKREMKR